jgi:hypothetical protein
MADEEILIEEIPSEKEDEDTPLPIYKIASYPADPTLEVIHQKWQRNEILIESFQRGWVWKPPQASRLIDSFLIGLPVPAIFVYKEPLTQKWIIIDGQQRFRTICSFFDGKLPDGSDFYLRGVSPQWEGKYYKDLNEADQRRIRDSVLRVIIVEQQDPKDDTSIYHIFERLNTGGTPLSAQEIRNCVSHGPFNDFLHELNKNSKWREITGVINPDIRMRDIELIVRFLALLEGGDSYEKPMKRYLNEYMRKHKREQKKEPYTSIFLNTVNKVLKSLGPRPFHLKRGINAAVFDCAMVAFAQSTKIPRDIKVRLQKLLDNPSLKEAISVHTTDVDKVATRIKLAREILFK